MFTELESKEITASVLESLKLGKYVFTLKNQIHVSMARLEADSFVVSTATSSYPTMCMSQVLDLLNALKKLIFIPGEGVKYRGWERTPEVRRYLQTYKPRQQVRLVKKNRY